MPYCNPKAPGEVQKLMMNTKKPATHMIKTEEPTMESPADSDLEESPPESPPQDVCGVSSPSPWLPLLISTLPSHSLTFVRWLE